MPRTGRPRKHYQTPEDQLRATHAADRRAISVARKRIKDTVEWKNAYEIQQKEILDRIKEEIMIERDRSGLSGR